jgi:hypothetical protein
MPIDFNAIVSLFRVPLFRELNPLKDSFRRLATWLAERFRQTNALELASRDFPVVRFYNEAVTAWVDAAQHATLGPMPLPRSVWETLGAAGQSLLSGLGVAGQSVREALILPRILGMVGAVLDLILESLERFAQPTPALFDPSGKRASDVFGELGLFFRGFGTSLGQVQEFVGGAQAMRQAISPPPDPFERLRAAVQGGSTSGPTSAATGGTTAEMLDDVGRYITGAILALPLLPALLGNILNSAGLALRVQVLDLFQGIEAQVLRLWRRAIEFVYVGLMEHIRHITSLAAALGVLLLDNLRYYVRFGLRLGQAFMAHFTTYLHDLSVYLQYWTRLVESVRRALEAFLNFDLMPVLLGALGLPGVVLAAVPGMRRFTIDDLFDVGIGVAVTAGRIALNIWLTAVEGAVLAVAGGSVLIPFVPTLNPRPILRRIEALRRILNLVVDIPARLPPETRLPSLAGVTFPNIYNAFFGTGAPNFRRALAGIRDRVVAEIPGILGAAAEFLRGVSDVFASAAGRAARLGSVEQYRAIADRAGALAEGIFGGQASELSQRISGAGSDPLAQSFETWVADGGFETIGQAIPLYVAEMQRYWQEQARAETPTSPHILRRRRPLGRVQTPRLTIRAPGRALDEELTATVAGRFREAIQDAYQTGAAQYGRAGAA